MHTLILNDNNNRKNTKLKKNVYIPSIVQLRIPIRNNELNRFAT